MKKMITAVCLLTGVVGPAAAGPNDGPVLEADTIVIQSNIRGRITNGRQASSSQTCFIWCVTSSVSEASGQLNVNGIVQHGSSALKARTIVLQATVTRDIKHEHGDLNYMGITQIGR